MTNILAVLDARSPRGIGVKTKREWKLASLTFVRSNSALLNFIGWYGYIETNNTVFGYSTNMASKLAFNQSLQAIVEYNVNDEKT